MDDRKSSDLPLPRPNELVNGACFLAFWTLAFPEACFRRGLGTQRGRGASPTLFALQSALNFGVRHQHQRHFSTSDVRRRRPCSKSRPPRSLLVGGLRALSVGLSTPPRDASGHYSHALNFVKCLFDLCENTLDLQYDPNHRSEEGLARKQNGAGRGNEESGDGPGRPRDETS